MNLSISQLKELSNEELRCRVAEELGWIYPGSTRLKHEQWRRWIPPKGSSTRTVPNYLESLDAIAEAEKTLSDEERIQYLMRLSQPEPSAMPLDPNYAEEQWLLITASARQRAIAFLAVRET